MHKFVEFVSSTSCFSVLLDIR